MATAGTLMVQAADTAEYWMHRAIETIDRTFGEGYAKDNPELVAGFMKAAATDQHAMYIDKLVANFQNNEEGVVALLRIGEAIEKGLLSVAEQMES